MIKEAVWFATTNHTPGSQRDICLFCTRRGGSTWVMETIAANKGVKFLDQPVEITTGSLTSAQFRAMPKFDAGQLIHVEGDDERQLRNYLERVFSGALPVNAPWRFWHRGFPFRSNRLVLKIVSAKAMIDWVDTNFDVDVVLVTRHPIPQALSCIRNGWRLTASAYLRNEWFVTSQLDDALLAYCWDVLRHGGQLEKFVLNWALENCVPLRLLPQRPHWSYVSYEALVLEPETVVRGLADSLSLPDVDAMLDVGNRPSRSSRLSQSQALIAGQNRNALVEDWQERVPRDEQASAMAILSRLGIDLYRTGDAMPTTLYRFGKQRDAPDRQAPRGPM